MCVRQTIDNLFTMSFFIIYELIFYVYVLMLILNIT